jgi:hypothetical protein
MTVDWPKRYGSSSPHFLEKPGEIAPAARNHTLDYELLNRNRPGLAVDPQTVLDRDLAATCPELPVAAVWQREAYALAVF